MVEPGCDPGCVWAEQSLLLSTTLYFFLHTAEGKGLTEVTEGARTRPKGCTGSGDPGVLRGVRCQLKSQYAISGATEEVRVVHLTLKG